MNLTYVRNGSFITDINSPEFDIIRQLNDIDEFAEALDNEDLSTYYQLLIDGGYVNIPSDTNITGSRRVQGVAIPQRGDFGDISIFRKLINFFILCDIDPLDYIRNEIPPFMFAECDFITKITVPNGITKVNRLAFFGCYRLEELILPNGIRSLGAYIFLNTALENKSRSIYLPDTIVPNLCSTMAFAGLSSPQCIRFSSRRFEQIFMGWLRNPQAAANYGN
jgi:hypothetical protein